MMTREDPGSFLPDFCGTRTVFVVILLAELLAIVLTLGQRAAFSVQSLATLAMYSLFIQWAALSCIAILCIFREHLHNLGDIQVGIISYLITQATTLLVAELAWWTPLMVNANWADAYVGHAAYLLRIMGISAIVWALMLRYFYVQFQLRRQIVAEADARFQALQSRIKPHFLFNCMNTIASLVRHDSAAAEETVEDLAGLFRVILKEQQRDHTLDEELDLCRRYLRIEQRRLGRRLEVRWELQEHPPDIRIPPLTLQPLVENAIYHGIESLAEGGQIVIHSESGPGQVRVRVTNTLPPDGSAPGGGNRIAQDNVRQRLESYYATPGLLVIEDNRQQYHVTVIIPHRHEDTHR